MNGTGAFGGRDPTRPETPAFTKPLPKRDAVGKGGMLADPVLYARLGGQQPPRPPKKGAKR